MKLTVICMDIVHIIRCNQTNIVTLRHLTERTVDRLFLGEPVILYLEEEVLLTKNLDILTKQSLCLLVIPAQDRLRYLSCHTGRERNDSLMIFSQELLINARLIVISLSSTRLR